MTRKRRRLLVVLLCGAGVGSATALALVAFRGSLVFFEAPSQLVAEAPRQGQVIRLGGLVEQGSLKHVVVQGQPTARFRITDGSASVPVAYVGILPDLFREGQGIVAVGEMRPDGVFGASEVLAKHDETYMPRDVAAALEKSGRWNPSAGPPPPAATWDMLMPKHGARG